MLSFTLQLRRWYAMDLYSAASGERHASPIWVKEVIQKKTGRNELDLHFWHSAYAEGIQDKIYPLRVKHRSEGFLLAVCGETGNAPVMILTELTPAWLSANLPARLTAPAGDLQVWCDEHIGHQ